MSTGDVVPAFGLHKISLVRASEDMFRQYVLDALDLGGYEGGLFPGRTVLSASSYDRPSPVAPLCAPSRHARGMFGFWIRQVMQDMSGNARTKPAVDERFIRGLSAVYQRDEERSLFLAADQWADAFLSL